MKEELTEILSKYKGERHELITILQDVQDEFGFLSKESLSAVADFLQTPIGSVYSVATFYNQFRFIPLGKHPIRVCMGTACHMAGGPLVSAAAERELGIAVGEVTEDLEYSIDRVACVGCCSLAPVVTVGDTFYPRMSPLRIEEVLASLRQETRTEDCGLS
ncbi:MAG: NAD(P)H-dependent oxidoreductase subunit E [Chloroflexota bacterium]|nr:NAD(P)H-dependent oxidoreductase subunit E [Chloroflexota bacterium]